MPVRPPVPVFLSLAHTRRRKGGDWPSPCIGVCRMSATSGLCEGCWRSIDEIREWSVMPEDRKQACWQRIEARQAAAGIRPLA